MQRLLGQVLPVHRALLLTSHCCVRPKATRSLIVQTRSSEGYTKIAFGIFFWTLPCALAVTCRVVGGLTSSPDLCSYYRDFQRLKWAATILETDDCNGIGINPMHFDPDIFVMTAVLLESVEFRTEKPKSLSQGATCELS